MWNLTQSVQILHTIESRMFSRRWVSALKCLHCVHVTAVFLNMGPLTVVEMEVTENECVQRWMMYVVLCVGSMLHSSLAESAEVLCLPILASHLCKVWYLE